MSGLRQNIIIPLLLISLFLFSGCGGSSSKVAGVDGEADSGINLEISGFYFDDISVETDPDMIKAGFPVRIRASIFASEPVDNLVVSYTLTDSNGVPSLLGSANIGHVDYGSGDYETTIILPDSIEEKDYKITGYLDPSERLLTGTYESKTSPQSDIAVKKNDGEPSIAVVNFNPDIDVILFESKAEAVQEKASDSVARIEKELEMDLSQMDDIKMFNGQMDEMEKLPKAYDGPKATGTIVVTSYGADAHDVPVSACLDTPSGCVSMLLWDSASQSYTKQILMRSLKKNVPTHAYLEMVLPEAKISGVTSVYNLSSPADSSIVISVNTDRSVRESASDSKVRTAALSPGVSFTTGDDNSIASRVTMYAPPVTIQVAGVCNNSVYSNGFGVGSNTDTGISASIEYGSGLTMCDDRMSSNAYVKAPVTFYGNGFDAVDADIGALLTYSNGSATLSYSLYLFERSAFQIQIFNSTVALPRYLSLPTSPLFEPYVNEDASYSKVFFVAYVIPVTVEAGVGIELGVNGSLVAMLVSSYYPTGALYGVITPYADVYAWATGALGAKFTVFGVEIATPQVGATVDVELINYQLPVSAGARFFVIQNVFRGYTYFAVSHNIQGLSGEFYLWASYYGPSGWPTDCKFERCFDDCDNIGGFGDFADCIIDIITGPYCVAVEAYDCIQPFTTHNPTWTIFDWGPQYQANQLLYYRSSAFTIP